MHAGLTDVNEPMRLPLDHGRRAACRPSPRRRAPLSRQVRCGSLPARGGRRRSPGERSKVSSTSPTRSGLCSSRAIRESLSSAVASRTVRPGGVPSSTRMLRLELCVPPPAAHPEPVDSRQRRRSSLRTTRRPYGYPRPRRELLLRPPQQLRVQHHVHAGHRQRLRHLHHGRRGRRRWRRRSVNAGVWLNAIAPTPNIGWMDGIAWLMFPMSELPVESSRDVDERPAQRLGVGLVGGGERRCCCASARRGTGAQRMSTVAPEAAAPASKQRCTFSFSSSRYEGRSARTRNRAVGAVRHHVGRGAAVGDDAVDAGVAPDVLPQLGHRLVGGHQPVQGVDPHLRRERGVGGLAVVLDVHLVHAVHGRHRRCRRARGGP